MSRADHRTIRRIYQTLFDAYGPQHWWPADTPIEMVVGAILTQNTAWTNVERAIANLKARRCLTWERLSAVAESELAEIIRPAGTFRVKASRIKSFVNALFERHEGSLERMLAGPLDQARGRLLAIRGVGPETADAILLYAGGWTSFVVDAYTERILRRHLLIGRDATYESVRELFHAAIDADAQVYNEYHALLVRVAKEHCRVKARCEGCPLGDMQHDAAL